MIILLILAFLVAMYFIGLGVIVAFVKETLHQSKIAREARKEQKRIMKQNKDNNRVQKTKLTKEEKMKIKHEANRVAYENNPKQLQKNVLKKSLDTNLWKEEQRKDLEKDNVIKKLSVRLKQNWKLRKKQLKINRWCRYDKV